MVVTTSTTTAPQPPKFPTHVFHIFITLSCQKAKLGACLLTFNISMLPPELLDQITSLNTQHRELLTVIHRLSQTSKIAGQLDLDDLVAQIKTKFAEADQDIEVKSSSIPSLTVRPCNSI